MLYKENLLEVCKRKIPKENFELHKKNIQVDFGSNVL